MHGKEILRRIKEEDIDCELILFTGYGSVSDAVECIKKGAYDYFIKPIENERLSIAVKRALEKKALRNENNGLKSELVDKAVLGKITFRSKKMELLIQKAKIAADTEATILITW